MSDQIELYDGVSQNPLDNVEDILNDNNWIYSRKNKDEIIVNLSGKACDYRMIFLWQEQMNALQLYCQYDMTISHKNIDVAACAIMNMNSNLWMGHFELNKDSKSPCFRQTNLINIDGNNKDYSHIEDLLEISLTQCERYQHVFELLSTDENIDMQILSFAMMETQGES